MGEMADYQLEQIELAEFQEQEQIRRIMKWSDEELLNCFSDKLDFYKSEYTKMVKDIVKKLKSGSITQKQRACLAYYLLNDNRK